MNKTRKITYSAVGAAIAALCVFLTNFGWLKVSLLMFAALCYYIVACKCGIWYGIAGIAVSLLIAFFTGGVTVLSSAFFARRFNFCAVCDFELFYTQAILHQMANGFNKACGYGGFFKPRACCRVVLRKVDYNNRHYCDFLKARRLSATRSCVHAFGSCVRLAV